MQSFRCRKLLVVWPTVRMHKSFGRRPIAWDESGLVSSFSALWRRINNAERGNISTGPARSQHSVSLSPLRRRRGQLRRRSVRASTAKQLRPRWWTADGPASSSPQSSRTASAARGPARVRRPASRASAAAMKSGELTADRKPAMSSAHACCPIVAVIVDASSLETFPLRPIMCYCSEPRFALDPFHTTDSDPTKLFCRVGVGGVKWVLDVTTGCKRPGQLSRSSFQAGSINE